MRNFNLRNLTDMQKGIIAIIVGLILLMHVLGILQPVTWILFVIAIGLFIYGVIATGLWRYIHTFFQKK